MSPMRQFAASCITLAALLFQPFGLWATVDCGCSVGGGTCDSSSTGSNCCCGIPDGDSAKTSSKSAGCQHCRLPARASESSDGIDTICHCGDHSTTPTPPPTTELERHSQLLAIIGEGATSRAGSANTFDSGRRRVSLENDRNLDHFKQVVLCVWLT